MKKLCMPYMPSGGRVYKVQRKRKRQAGYSVTSATLCKAGFMPKRQ